MTVTIKRKPAPPLIPSSVLDCVPDADTLHTLIGQLQASTEATARFRYRRLLQLHVQVMRCVPKREQAIAYVEQELLRHPPLFTTPEGSHHAAAD